MANYVSAAEYASPGSGSGMSDLFQNRLLLQYLSGVGASFDPEGPAGAMNQITQQTIGAQSKHELQTRYMQMLQQMLGGIPQGGKLSGDRDSLTIKIPTSSLAKDEFDPLARTEAGGGTPYGGEIDWSKPENQGQLSAFLREGSLDPYR